MRLPFLAALVCTSLFANAFLFHQLGSKQHEQELAAVAKASALAAQQKKQALAPSPEAKAWGQLYTQDLAVLTARLRQSGMSDRLVRALVNAELDQRFSARKTALSPQKKAEDKWWAYSDRHISWKNRLALLDLEREQRAMSEQLLGPLPLNDDDKSLARLPVPAEKRQRTEDILDDYDVLIGEVKGNGRALMQSELDRLKYLESERAKDLDELLTPEERSKLEKIIQPSASQLGSALQNIDVTEDEFYTLLEVQKTYEEERKYKQGFTYENMMFVGAHYEEGLRSVLGEARYQESYKNSDNGYRELLNLVTRKGLTEQVASDVYALRSTLATESERIADDTQMDEKQKSDALKLLAGTIRSQIIAKLGYETGTAYIKAHGYTDNVANGMVLHFSRNSMSSRPATVRRTAANPSP
jgi:hypothetical protein